jgi:hypothetical protein
MNQLRVLVATVMKLVFYERSGNILIRRATIRDSSGLFHGIYMLQLYYKTLIKQLEAFYSKFQTRIGDFVENVFNIFDFTFRSLILNESAVRRIIFRHKGNVLTKIVEYVLRRCYYHRPTSCFGL